MNNAGASQINIEKGDIIQVMKKDRVFEVIAFAHNGEHVIARETHENGENIKIPSVEIVGVIGHRKKGR